MRPRVRHERAAHHRRNPAPAVDELFAAFVASLPGDLAAQALGLSVTLGLAPSKEVPWSQVFSHEITLGAPALVAEAMPEVPEATVRHASLAHLLAILEGSARTASRIDRRRPRPSSPRSSRACGAARDGSPSPGSPRPRCGSRRTRRRRARDAGRDRRRAADLPRRRSDRLRGLPRRLPRQAARRAAGVARPGPRRRLGRAAHAPPCAPARRRLGGAPAPRRCPRLGGRSGARRGLGGVAGGEHPPSGARDGPPCRSRSSAWCTARVSSRGCSRRRPGASAPRAGGPRPSAPFAWRAWARRARGHHLRPGPARGREPRLHQPRARALGVGEDRARLT